MTEVQLRGMWRRGKIVSAIRKRSSKIWWLKSGGLLEAGEKIHQTVTVRNISVMTELYGDP